MEPDKIQKKPIQQVLSTMFNYKLTLILSFLFFLSSSANGQPIGQWKEMPPMPSKRTEVSVAILNNIIYVIGGFTNNGVADLVDVWNPETKKWSHIPPLPRPLHHTTVSAINGKLYVIGGFASGMWTPVNTNYEYDPKVKKWANKTPMPTKRGAHAAAVIDGKIYVVGGANRKRFNLINTAALEVYDPIKDVWKKLAPIPTPRDHLTASSFDEKLYAIGGRINVDFNDNLDTNEVYDPTTNLWNTLSPLPTKRSGITSQVLNKNILVFGGESEKGTFSENEAYEPKTDTWKTLSPMPSGRHGLGSAYYRNTIHLFGGGPKAGGGGSNTHSIFSIKD